MKNENFERELPFGYKQALHINAKNNKTGVIFNLVAAAIAFSVIAIAAILAVVIMKPEFWQTDESLPADTWLVQLYVGILIGTGAFVAYVVLHELTHGAAYKCLTGEKLTFGLTLTVAFCGVPNIYVNRKTALISCSAPLVLFSVLLIPMGAVCLSFMALYQSAAAFTAFVAITFVFAFHLGGCSGDMYLILLLLTKYKDKKTLIRDTGPEQFIYERTALPNMP